MSFNDFLGETIRSWADEVEDGVSLTTDEIQAAENLLLLKNSDFPDELKPPSLQRQPAIVIPYTPAMHTLHPSIPMNGDKYDYLGRNKSALARRQSLVPWKLVQYSRPHTNF
jgi:hypothetical protein